MLLNGVVPANQGEVSGCTGFRIAPDVFYFTKGLADVFYIVEWHCSCQSG